MLFIATMEKVKNTVWGSFYFFLKKFKYSAPFVCVCLSGAISRCSRGGSGKACRTQTCGTTVGLTTSQGRGCAHPPKKLVRAVTPMTHGLVLNLQTNIDSLTPVDFSPDWLQAVQVLMVLSVVFSSVSFLVFLGQLFTMSKGGLFYFTGLCQVFAGNGGVPQCVTGIH